MSTAAAPPSPNPKSNPNHPSKTGRRPLQPKNHLHHHVNNNNNTNYKPKLPKTGWIEISSLSTADNDESNKENPHHTHPPTKKKSLLETKTTLDASLAEELSAIREKLERMRFDKDETEKMLRERDLVLDMQMNQLLERGHIQRMLEIEVDRLYRLNQLRSSCLVGYNVVTPGQQNIGKVRGYTFNINSGDVESLELDSFGISIIPSSLVSTYALFVEDVLEVVSDTVVVHEAAASRIQRLTKGFWDAQKMLKSMDELGEYSDLESPVQSDYGRRRRRSSISRNPHPKVGEMDYDWELPMDYL